MAIPVIYKGDDTDFRGSTGFTLKVVTSSNLNLSGCTVEVEVLGFKRSFPASATGELVCPFAFSAAETQRMPLGIHAATVRVYDSKGRVRTINNSIRVKVTNNVHEAYGKDDPQEVTLAISTVDLEPYAKKDEVTAAIEKAMKDAGASVKLHAITPEVADTTVTLKPVDGAANHVGGKVGVSEVKDITERFLSLGECRLESYTSNFALWLYVDAAKVRVSPTDEANLFVFTFLEDALIKMYEPIYDSEVVGRIPAGEARCTGRLSDASELNKLGYCEVYVTRISFSYELNYDVIKKLTSVTDISSDTCEILFMDYSKLQNIGELPPPRHLIVVLPSAADHARKFSLAVETDTETEKAVEWQGGEVIEAVPGVSRLVPGLNVWDVAEVAPGKFKVERASSPAQSVPLTLTAPGGRVAELTVDDDLVLEVKEI